MDEISNIKSEIEELLNSAKINGNLSLLANSLSRHKEMRRKIITVTPYVDVVHHTTKKVPTPPMSFRIYCILNNIFDGEHIPKCRCGKPKAFDSMDRGFKLSCGNRSCYQSLPETNKKRQQTTIKNFGSLSKAYDNSTTMKNKYGEDNCSKLNWVKEKKKRTSRKNWGSDYPWQTEEGKRLQKEGVQKKWDVDNISQHDSIKQKKVETSRKHWGTDNPSQNILIRKKILAQNGVEYITPSGNKFLIDGCENIALDYLYEEYDENIIIPQPEVTIDYFDDDNKKHVWFPDVQINLDPIHLIEIKLFDFISTKRFLYNQIVGGISQGYNTYILFIFNEDLYTLFLTDIMNRHYKIYPLTRDTVPESMKIQLVNYNFRVTN